MADRTVYTKAALYGILIYLMAPVLFFIAVMIGDPAEAGFVLFFFIPAVIIGAAVYFVRPWGLILGIVGGLFGLMAFLDGVDLILSTPQAFFDFAGTLFGLVGLLILIVSSVLGLIAHFRGGARTTPTPTESLVFRGILGVLVVLAVISAVLTVINAGGVSEAEAQGATVLIAEDADWDVDTISATGGQPLKILVKNKDPILHTFTISDLDIDKKIGPFSEEIVEIQPRAGATYGFICRVVGHEEDMTGAIVVK